MAANCAASGAEPAWTPVPDGLSDTSSNVRGNRAAAGAISNNEQTQMVSHVLRSYFRPLASQARWMDARPLAHERSAADDTVGADHDFAEDVVAATKSLRFCVLNGDDSTCRGKPGGVVRFSWPYLVAKDSAIVFATWAPRDSAGVVAPVEQETQFRLTKTDAGMWYVAGRRVVSSPGVSFLALTNVTVVDVRGGKTGIPQTVIVSGTRIKSVAPSRSARIPKGARVIDARGKFLIPGLWDMHVHADVVRGRDLLSLYVGNGVTGVRDMAGTWATLTGWRREIAAGTLAGPRIVASGPYLEGGEVPIPHILTRTPAEGMAGVDSLVVLGADFVKVHGQLRPETYYAIARRARERGIVFSGHVSQAVGAANASDSGQRSLEHMLAIPAPCTAAESLALRPRFPVQSAVGRCRSTDLSGLYAGFVRNKTWVTPTFVAAVEIAKWPRRDLPGDSLAGYLPDTLRKFVLQLFPMPDSIPAGADSVGTAMLAKRMRQAADMHRAGVGILAGTDAPLRNSPPGFGLHEELSMLVRGGLSPLEALRAATLAPALYLNATDSLGTVEAGKLADLVLLDANPLQDINNTRRIAAVVFNGKYIDGTERAKMVKCCNP
jgi:imidazolonepropionase-like amidohydrolase